MVELVFEGRPERFGHRVIETHPTRARIARSNAPGRGRDPGIPDKWRRSSRSDVRANISKSPIAWHAVRIS